VTLDDPSDTETVVTLLAFLDGAHYSQTQTPPGGGPYVLERLPDGTYTVGVHAQSYRMARAEDLVIAGGAGIEDVDFTLAKVPGAIMGTISVEGPPSDATIYAVNKRTGEVGGDGIKTVPGGTGGFEILAVEDSEYDLIAEARGYVAFDSTVVIDGDTSHVEIVLPKALATKYVFVDAEANQVFSERISKSLPDEGVFDWAELVFEPRDDAGNIAVFDETAVDSVMLSASLLDPAVPPRGAVVFADSLGVPIPDNMLTAEMFVQGMGRFWVRDDSVEVLRVQVARGGVTGSIEVGVGELEPVRVGLSPDTDRITVGGQEKIGVTVQLLDVSGNATPTPDVGIRLEAAEGSAIFEPEVGITDANGLFVATMYGFTSGKVIFTARVEPGAYAGLPADTVTVHFDPAQAARITSTLSPRAVKPGGQTSLTFQVVDAYGNKVKQEAVAVNISATPADLLASLETPVFTDTSGLAVSDIVAGSRYGVASLETVAPYPTDDVRLSIDARLVSVDETAPETDSRHNSLEGADLTTMFGWLGTDTLTVALDFSSSWDGMHIVVALETKADMAGASGDPFQFPIFYRHTQRPDYVFTYKYSSDDYADLRRPLSGSTWEFWQLENAIWTTDENDPGKNAVGIVTKTDDQVLFKFPLSAVGDLSAGSTVRLQAYVTQESFGNKYNALDSNPHDLTHDMEPDEGDWWDTATSPVTLSKYAVHVFPEAGAAPQLTGQVISPSIASPDDRVKFMVSVADDGGGIGDVFVDLGAIGGDAFTRLRDDGLGGDEVPLDGNYSIDFVIPDGVPQGIHVIAFAARDSLNISENQIVGSIIIVNPPEVIIAVTDSVGDDHGPNITDDSGNPEDGLYYIYPTNGVFSPGAFDIEGVEFMIVGDFLVVRIHVGEIPSSEAVGWNAPYPGATCTNPNKADLNLQKIDIYIDSKEGAGATAGLPYRYVDIARSDAWEYAVAIEGWWRGLIASNGQNSISFWTINRLAGLLDFCNDHVEDYVDVWIALSAIGDPSAEDIKKWDFIITMASHDGGSDDQNLGGSRWVNNATSEWQFGNGRDGEGGRERDANVMDVVTVPGEGKEPGRSQEEMLNYLLPDALRRFDNGLTACILEATSSVDISPPIISPFPTNGFAHAVWYVLEHAPASFWTKVEDENQVDKVEFLWRALGGTIWNTVAMVNITEDYWIADLDPVELREAVGVVEMVDGTLARPFEAIIKAVDEYGNEAQTALLTFAIPDDNLAYAAFDGVKPGETLIFYDGTIVSVPSVLRSADGAATYDSLYVKIVPLGYTGTETVDLANIRPSMTFLDVARRLEIIGIVGQDRYLISELTKPLSLALHYPTYIQSSLLDEKRIGLFRFNEQTERWLTIFGSVNEAGNAVATEVRGKGTFALFGDSRLGYNLSDGLSGVDVAPNPFSPNGDGIYEETYISFFLSREADWVTIEIYDISGEEVRTIRWQQGLTDTGRNDFEIVWDGADDNGDIVPYGIYIIRVEVRFKVAPYNERQNIAVAVIK
jgi:hypothetical protein